MLRGNKKGQMTWEQILGGLLIIAVVGLVGYLAYRAISVPTEAISLIPNAFPSACMGYASPSNPTAGLDDYCRFRTEGATNLYYNCLYPPVQAAIKAEKTQQKSMDCGVSDIYKPAVQCASVCTSSAGTASKVNAGTIKFDGVKYKCPAAGAAECSLAPGATEVAMTNAASMSTTA